jgi:GNAT superfamily N-acetyltransferase
MLEERLLSQEEHEMKDLLIGMHRPHMNDIPQYPLADGYRFRPLEVGDEEAWLRVQDEANQPWGGIIPGTFERAFGNTSLLKGRSWFVVDPDGSDVANASAWVRTEDHSVGLVHWVAVLSGYQGKGIGKALMTQVTNRLAEEYSTAYLNTGSARVAAIKVYLDFGFLPDMKKEKAEEGWAELRDNLRHPVLGNV